MGQSQKLIYTTHLILGVTMFTKYEKDPSNRWETTARIFMGWSNIFFHCWQCMKYVCYKNKYHTKDKDKIKDESE